MTAWYRLSNEADDGSLAPRKEGKTGLNEQPKHSNPIAVIAMLAVFALAIAWLVPAGLSGDIRWFLPGVTGQPSHIVIWHGGQQTTVTANDADYAAITTAAHEAISHIVGSSDYGPSPITVAEYRQSFSIEVFYDQPVQIHSRFNLGHPRQIMVPLTGTGFTEGRFFIGADGTYRAAGPITRGLPGVKTAVESALARRGVAAPTAGAPIR
jgi:hypothetical protein